MDVMLAIVGFAVIICSMILLMKGKISPVIVFIAVPVFFGLLYYYVKAFTGGDVAVSGVFKLVTGYVRKGVGTTTGNAVLLLFSILFFGVMSDVGVFDVIVNALLKCAGSNVIAVTVATAVIAVIGHLDGATVTTVLITVPALYPIYKRLHMRPQILLLLTAVSMGVMNLVPWGGPTVRAATVLKMDASVLWQSLIPMQVVGLICAVGLGAIMGIAEKRRGAGLVPSEAAAAEAAARPAQSAGHADLVRPNLVWFNGLLVLALVIALAMNLATAYVLFMIALAVALIVNYPSMKLQDSRIKAHAGNAVMVAGTMLAAGAFVGILGESGMLEAMTKAMLALVPASLGKYVHIIFGVLGLPLGMVTGTDAYFYGIMPLVIGVGEEYGVAGINTALAMLLGKNVSLLISPMVPATFLAIGFTDVPLKEHIAFSFKWLFGVSIIMVFAGVLMGIVAM